MFLVIPPVSVTMGAWTLLGYDLGGVCYMYVYNELGASVISASLNAKME